MHIMLLIKEMKGGVSPDLSSDDIDQYCERVLKVLENKRLEQYALEACRKFEEIRAKWIALKGEQYKYGIKDSADFRGFLIKEIHGISEHHDAEKLYTGYVMNIDLDKHNTLFGFIDIRLIIFFFMNLIIPLLIVRILEKGSVIRLYAVMVRKGLLTCGLFSGRRGSFWRIGIMT